MEKWADYEGLTVKEETSPYPSDKPYSIASLTVWKSPDADDPIEVRLLALRDKGHWHSEDISAGVSTTQEIWRFFRRYVLPDESSVPVLDGGKTDGKDTAYNIAVKKYPATAPNNNPQQKEISDWQIRP